jgi:serine/threonine-protein kinase
LAKAHDLGVVHRDIKPDNIFLLEGEREMFVKVLDFVVALDLSEQADRLTMDGALVGTPHFMAPEQMMGSEHVGPAADVWALGVVAYLCLTQRLPYSGDSVAAIAVAVDRGSPEPPSKYAPELPPAIDEWMARALEPCAEKRFRDGREMIDALEEALAIAKGDRSRVPTVRDGEVTVRYPRGARKATSLDAATVKMRARRGPVQFLAASIVITAVLASVWLGWSTPHRAPAIEGSRAVSPPVEVQPAEPRRPVKIPFVQNR